MDKRELSLFLHSGHCVDVDVQEVKEAPGYIRKVTIYPDGLHQDYSVSIAYEHSKIYIEQDIEGAELKYVAQYPNQETLLEDLEDFLGKPIDQWTNYTLAPIVPVTLEPPSPQESLAYLESIVRNGSVPLPRFANYEIASLYFQHIKQYGEFRPDLMVHQDDDEEIPFDENLDE